MFTKRGLEFRESLDRTGGSEKTMAITSLMLQRLVWITAPSALYLSLHGIQELNRGAAWNGAAYAAMTVLVVAVPLIAKGHVPGSRLAITWLGVFGAGIVTWLAAPATSFRIVGFIIAVVAQLAVAVAARRVGAEPRTLRDDSTIELRIGGGPPDKPMQPTSGGREGMQ